MRPHQRLLKAGVWRSKTSARPYRVVSVSLGFAAQSKGPYRRLSNRRRAPLPREPTVLSVPNRQVPGHKFQSDGQGYLEYPALHRGGLSRREGAGVNRRRAAYSKGARCDILHSVPEKGDRGGKNQLFSPRSVRSIRVVLAFSSATVLRVSSPDPAPLCGARTLTVLSSPCSDATSTSPSRSGLGNRTATAAAAATAGFFPLTAGGLGVLFRLT